MIAWLLFPLASAADYGATDVLAAWRSGLPEPTFGALVGRAAASDVERACLVAAGVPAEVVARIAGAAAPAATPGAAPASLAAGDVPSVCGPLGLHVDTVDSVDAINARADRRARAAEAADQAALVDRVSCFAPTFRRSPKEELEAWMKARVRAGATGFLTVSRASFNGSASPPLVCSW